jgi:transposase-like protein
MNSEIKSDKTEKRGRPTKYSDELADEVCLRIATSKDGIHKIAEEFGIGAWTLFNWKYEHEYFSHKYARAKELQAEFLKQQIIDIADDSTNDEEVTEYGVKMNREFVERSKLRVQTRQWLMGRLAPKEYGDKKQEEDTAKEITIRVVED